MPTSNSPCPSARPRSEVSTSHGSAAQPCQSLLPCSPPPCGDGLGGGVGGAARLGRAATVTQIAIYALPLLASLAATSPAAAKPRVPIGTDPGGSAIAIIGSGVDYTRPEIAARLARDGEGELVGWDSRDTDRAPYEPPAATGAPGPGTAAASLLITETRATRLVVLAPKPDAVSLGQAAYFVLRSPARIALVTLSSTNAEDWKHLAEVARRAPHLLLVASAGDDGADLDKTPRYPASLGLDNVLVVTASGEAGKPLATANTGPKSVDLAAPETSGSRLGSVAAAARVTALAARVSAADPSLAGAGLKARVLSLAKPLAAAATRYGWIADPSRP